MNEEKQEILEINKIEEAKQLLAEEEAKKAKEFSEKYVALCKEYGMEIGVNFMIRKIN